MTKKRAIKLILGIVIAVLCTPLVMFGVLIFGQNIMPAVYFTVFVTKPSSQELAGKYTVSMQWGNASLEIRNDGTFVETTRTLQTQSDQIAGVWKTAETSELGGLNIICYPFIGITDNSQIRYEHSELAFYKSRFGGIFADFQADDPDAPTRFRKQ